MRVLLAPDHFSGALSAVEAAAAIRRGWLAQAPGSVVVPRPMSDGSRELLEVVHAAVGGQILPRAVTGPSGGTVPAGLLRVPGARGGTVYVDGGQVLGRQLTPPGAELQHAAHGTSRGLGELLLAALELDASRVVVGLGEAASHDAGAGLLEVVAGPSGDLGEARARLAQVDVVVAAADTTPLLGLHGAGAALADRPGIGPAEAQRLDTAVADYVAELVRHRAALPTAREPLPLAGQVHDHGHRPASRARPGRADGSGTGGGAGHMLELLGARVLPGAEVVAHSVGLAGAVGDSDIVVTGCAVLEGAGLDRGVVPAVGAAAMQHGLPVVVLAEEVRTSRREVAQAGISATYETGEEVRGSLEALEYWARRVARTWARSA